MVIVNETFTCGIWSSIRFRHWVIQPWFFSVTQLEDLYKSVHVENVVMLSNTLARKDGVNGGMYCCLLTTRERMLPTEVATALDMPFIERVITPTFFDVECMFAMTYIPFSLSYGGNAINWEVHYFRVMNREVFDYMVEHDAVKAQLETATERARTRVLRVYFSGEINIKDEHDYSNFNYHKHWEWTLNVTAGKLLDHYIPKVPPLVTGRAYDGKDEELIEIWKARYNTTRQLVAAWVMATTNIDHLEAATTHEINYRKKANDRSYFSVVDWYRMSTHAQTTSFHKCAILAEFFNVMVYFGKKVYINTWNRTTEEYNEPVFIGESTLPENDDWLAGNTTNARYKSNQYHLNNFFRNGRMRFITGHPVMFTYMSTSQIELFDIDDYAEAMIKSIADAIAESRAEEA